MSEHQEGEWFIQKRIGKPLHPWGVYQRIGGQDIRVTAFKDKDHAAMYAAAQKLSTSTTV